MTPTCQKRREWLLAAVAMAIGPINPNTRPRTRGWGSITCTCPCLSTSVSAARESLIPDHKNGVTTDLLVTPGMAPLTWTPMLYRTSHEDLHFHQRPQPGWSSPLIELTCKHAVVAFHCLSLSFFRIAVTWKGANFIAVAPVGNQPRTKSVRGELFLDYSWVSKLWVHLH